MPTDNLITASPHRVAAGVLEVLAGADLTTIAATCHVDPADLADAIEVYQAAGLAALERRAEQQWYDVRILFPDWPTAEATAAAHLRPRLDQLQASKHTAGWWFLRKHPHWRLRLRDGDPNAVAYMLDDLTAAGVITGWWPTVYEPETTAFGGPAGIHAVHDLFCADSHGVLDYAQHDAPGLGRRELSLLLINAMHHAAGLDWSERGDVFARVAQLRPAPADTDTVRIDELTKQVRTLFAASPNSDGPLFASDGPAGFVAPWLAAFSNGGRQLGEAAARSRLDRGPRTVLAHIVIFHWNRLGLSATTQSLLAHAAHAAILPPG